MPKYDLNIVGERFDKATLDQYHAFKQMQKNNVPMYQEMIDRIQNLPASHGIAVYAMIRGDGGLLAKELGDPSLAFFDASMIPKLLDEMEYGNLKPIDPERSAREFNRPFTILDRMGAIVETMEAENAGRADAMKDAKTKMESDLRGKKRELKADKSYSRNPIKRWVHRRSEFKKFELGEKAKYAAFCQKQKEEGDAYRMRIEQYHKIKENGVFFSRDPKIDDMASFVERYERKKYFDALAKTPISSESRYYEDAQAIKKGVDLTRQVVSHQQERGSAQKISAQKTMTIKNPTKEIREKDEL